MERNKDIVSYLGLWEQLNNPNFKGREFTTFENKSGANSFYLSPEKWVNATNAIGIIVKRGNGGGTYAHRDIAFEFASWLSPEFKLYLVTEFQRLKAQEQKTIEWSAKRELAKVNYRIHTDAIKENKVAGYLNKNAVDGLSIENHNKIIAAINSNYYSATTVTLIDANGNTLAKYTFDTDTSLVKKQGKIEGLAVDKSSFEFGDKTKTYSITYLRGQFSDTLGLFEVGSEHGNSRLADGVYPTSYRYGEKVTISTLKTNYGCGGIYHSGSGSPSATYKFKGWYLDWNLTQPFTGEFPAGTVGDIVLYADITCTGTHFY